MSLSEQAVTGRVIDLKTWPEPFAAIRAGLKPWELRFDDRDYQVGDTLRLREWNYNFDGGVYTGEVEERVVTWKLDGGKFGLPKGYVILSLAARQDGSAEDDGAAMRHTLSVQATDKSDRAEGVAALQQAGDFFAFSANKSSAEQIAENAHCSWRPIETAPKDGSIIDVWRPEGGRDTVFWGFPSHECGEMGQYCDSEWHSIRAPGWVCSTFNQLVGRKHAPFTHWMPLPSSPLPQQTALVEPYSSDLDDVNGHLA